MHTPSRSKVKANSLTTPEAIRTDRHDVDSASNPHRRNLFVGLFTLALVGVLVVAVTKSADWSVVDLQSILSPASTLAGGFALQSVPATPAPSSPNQESDAQCLKDRLPTATCTSTDVRIVGASSITILDDGCSGPGDTVDFQATFEVSTTSNERYDVGLWFADDGDSAHDGALTGKCTNSLLPISGSNFVNADRDVCGDVRSSAGAVRPVIRMRAVCNSRPGSNKLSLPNCVSWAQQAAADCQKPQDLLLGSTTRCGCNGDFEIDINVPVTNVALTYTANPATINEPGADVTFTASFVNRNPFKAATIKSLTDSTFGAITDCGSRALPISIAAGQSYSCSFVRHISGNGAFTQSNTLSGCAYDTDSTQTACSESTATITGLDVQPTLTVTKSYAAAQSVSEPGGAIAYQVEINNVGQEAAVVLTWTDTCFPNEFSFASGCASIRNGCTASSPLACRNADGTEITGTTPTSLQGTVIAPGTTLTCSYAAFVCGDVGNLHNSFGITVKGDEADATVVTPFSTAVDTPITDVVPEVTYRSAWSFQQCQTADQKAGLKVRFRSEIAARLASTDNVTINGWTVTRTAAGSTQSRTIDCLNDNTYTDTTRDGVFKKSGYKLNTKTNVYAVTAFPEPGIEDDRFLNTATNDGTTLTYCDVDFWVDSDNAPANELFKVDISTSEGSENVRLASYSKQYISEHFGALRASIDA